MLNNVMFFLAFTVLRIVMFPIIFVVHSLAGYRYFNIHDGTASNWKFYTFYTILVIFAFILALNLFWYRIIIRGLLKVLSKNTEKDKLS